MCLGIIFSLWNKMVEAKIFVIHSRNMASRTGLYTHHHKGMPFTLILIGVVVLLVEQGIWISAEFQGGQAGAFVAARTIYASDKAKYKMYDADIKEIKKIVGRVRAGKNLNPDVWPNESKVAVLLSFDMDTETISLRIDDLSIAAHARGEFGARVGVPRILNLLSSHKIPATFFIPAVSALLHKDRVELIQSQKQKHEFGIHGWVHEKMDSISAKQELDFATRAFETLKTLTGVAPVGIRTPSWDVSNSTVGIIKKLGLIYDSSLMADDRPYELKENGKNTGIIELPVSWILDDVAYFSFGNHVRESPLVSPDEILEIWKAEFDTAYKEGTTFVLTMHPFLIGRRSRIIILEKLIKYIKCHEGVWFATHADTAQYVKDYK